jgi:hypothetical protein
LLLSALVLGSLFFFDSPWSSTAASTYGWYEPAVVAMIVGAVGVAIGSIFLYGSRKTQRTVVIAAQGLTALLTATLYGGLFLTGELSVQGEDGVQVSKAAMLSLPVVAYVLMVLARRGIEHDIKIVEDSERMRLRG